MSGAPYLNLWTKNTLKNIYEAWDCNPPPFDSQLIDIAEHLSRPPFDPIGDTIQTALPILDYVHYLLLQSCDLGVIAGSLLDSKESSCDFRVHVCKEEDLYRIVSEFSRRYQGADDGSSGPVSVAGRVIPVGGSLPHRTSKQSRRTPRMTVSRKLKPRVCRSKWSRCKVMRVATRMAKCSRLYCAESLD